jgi:hypothetical protein
MPPVEGGGASGGAARQQNSAPRIRIHDLGIDLEKLAKQAAALAALREKSVVVGGYYVNEALRDLLEKVYKIDEKLDKAVEGIDSDYVRNATKARLEREIHEYVLDALAKYRVYEDEETDGDVYIFADYDMKSVADGYFVKLVYIYGAEDAIEEYLTEKLSSRTRRWSFAYQALKLAEEAGFKIDVIATVENADMTKNVIKIVAPTNEEFTILEEIEYSTAYYSFDEP